MNFWQTMYQESVLQLEVFFKICHLFVVVMIAELTEIVLSLDISGVRLPVKLKMVILIGFQPFKDAFRAWYMLVNVEMPTADHQVATK